MPDFGSATFSQTDSSNASGTMPSWSGSAAPSTLDDAGRALQGAVTREWNWRSYTLTAGGSADSKTLTYSVAPAAYYNGQRFSFIANTVNTGSATLNVNSLGAKSIRKMIAGTATTLAAGDMVAGSYVEVAYNTAGDYFVWLNRGLSSFPAGSASAPSIIPDGDTNTGIWFPAADTVAVSTAGGERLRIDSSGSVGIAGATTTKLGVISDSGMPGSGNMNTGFSVAASAASYAINIGSSSVLTYSWINSAFINNSGVAAPLVLATGAIERMRIDASGNVLLTGSGGLGYGTGSGGTVTQITSKGTTVTLNKTNGQITMNAAALASATDIQFIFNNSTIAATDNVVVTANFSGAVYKVNVYSVSAGSCSINVRQDSGGSRSDAVVLNFAVIKAVTS